MLLVYEAESGATAATAEAAAASSVDRRGRFDACTEMSLSYPVDAQYGTAYGNVPAVGSAGCWWRCIAAAADAASTGDRRQQLPNDSRCPANADGCEGGGGACETVDDGRRRAAGVSGRLLAAELLISTKRRRSAEKSGSDGVGTSVALSEVCVATARRWTMHGGRRFFDNGDVEALCRRRRWR